jgi:hypothetical protein
MTLHRAVLLCMALAVLAPSVPATERPNILYIMADDHAAHAISAYGSSYRRQKHRTPVESSGGGFYP